MTHVSNLTQDMECHGDKVHVPEVSSLNLDPNTGYCDRFFLGFPHPSRQSGITFPHNLHLVMSFVTV